MKKAELKISIEKVDEGTFKDSISCSGCEVEVLGMIRKTRIIIDDIESKVIESITEKVGQ